MSSGYVLYVYPKKKNHEKVPVKQRRKKKEKGKTPDYKSRKKNNIQNQYYCYTRRKTERSQTSCFFVQNYFSSLLPHISVL